MDFHFLAVLDVYTDNFETRVSQTNDVSSFPVHPIRGLQNSYHVKVIEWAGSA